MWYFQYTRHPFMSHPNGELCIWFIQHNNWTLFSEGLYLAAEKHVLLLYLRMYKVGDDASFESFCLNLVFSYCAIFFVDLFLTSHCELDSRSWRGVLDITCNKVCQWFAQDGGFLQVLRVLLPIKQTATI